MTRSERRKVNFEILKKKEMLKIKRVVTIETIFDNCKDCEFSEKIDLSEDRYKILCKKKSRKDIDICGKIKKIGFYPYGEVNGSCPNLTLMMFDDDMK